MLSIYKKTIQLHQKLDSKLVGEGVIKIKKIPHEARYFEGKDSKCFNLGTVFTTKKISAMRYNGVKVQITADRYHFPLKFDRTQFHNTSLMLSTSIDNSIRIEKLNSLLTKKDIISNIVIRALSKKNYLQIFKDNQIIIHNVDKDITLYEKIIKPEIFVFLNSESKLVVESVFEIRSAINLNELELLQQTFKDISYLSYSQYHLLLTAQPLDLEGLIKDTFNFIKFV